MRSVCGVLVFIACVSLCLIGCSDISAETLEYEIIVFEYNNELSDIIMEIDGEMYYSSESSEINNPWISIGDFKDAPLKEIFEIPAGVVDERKYTGYIRTNDENKYFVELQPIPNNGAGMITLKRDMDVFPSLEILDNAAVNSFDMNADCSTESSDYVMIFDKEIIDSVISNFFLNGDVKYTDIRKDISLTERYLFRSEENAELAVEIMMYYDQFGKYYMESIKNGYLHEVSEN